MELSDSAKGNHKFYEVSVDGDTVTTRFGRIGTAGRVKADVYTSAEEALRVAEKKVAEKLDRGYEVAAPGLREKRPVQKRARVSVEDQLATLAACRNSLTPGFSKYIIFLEGEGEDYEREPYSLLLTVLGGDAGEQPYGFLSSDIWHFDT